MVFEAIGPDKSRIRRINHIGIAVCNVTIYGIYIDFSENYIPKTFLWFTKLQI